jgi:hypothetical protein
VFSHPSSSASSSSRPLLACFSSHHTLLSPENVVYRTGSYMLFKEQ